MIKRVLIVLALFMVIALGIVWLITGGIGKVTRAAHLLSNPISLIIGTGTNSGYGLQLPWQPQETTRGPDISNYGSDGEPDLPDINDLQNKTDDARQQMYDAKTFGDPSPYKGKVTLSNLESPSDGTSRDEYLEIHASSGNTAPITVTGWYLQSVLTGVHIPLPAGATVFMLGVVNPVTSVSLSPGQYAVVNSGTSPVGVSFRENLCSGYLAQYQTFVPDLEHACPDPKKALPEIPENLKTYRASCFEFVQTLSSCEFPGTILPENLTLACKAFVSNTYTYNGCVNTYQFRTDFRKDTWRLFLGSSDPLWNNSHDIIRLLDQQGRTVDVLTY